MTTAVVVHPQGEEAVNPPIGSRLIILNENDAGPVKDPTSSLAHIRLTGNYTHGACDENCLFGSGHHPTSRLCLEWLCEVEEELCDAYMIDYGTGTGLLGVAAVVLGAQV